MPPSILPDTSNTALTGLTLEDILGSSDLLGLNDDPLLKAVLGNDPFGLGFAKKKKGPKYEPLPPEEQKSIVDQALSLGMGGLQAIGDTLNFAGSHVRGVLAGTPGTATSGEQLNEAWGISPGDQPLFFNDEDLGGYAKYLPTAKTVAGLGTEVFTDPLTYATFGAGALTKSGKIAQMAGIPVKGAAKAQTLREVAKGADKATRKQLFETLRAQGVKAADLPALADDMLGGAFGVHVPWGGTYIPEIAKTAGARAVAGAPAAALGKAGELVGKIPGVGPVLEDMGDAVRRGWDAAFDPAVQGQYDATAQEVARAGYAAANKGRREAIAQTIKFTDDVDELSRAFHESNGSGQTFESSRDIIQRAIQESAETRSTERSFGGMNVPFPIRNWTQSVGDDFVAAQNAIHASLKDMGVPAPEMFQTEAMRHLFRQTTAAGAEKTFQERRALGTGASGLKPRVEETKHFGSETVNSMLLDPVLMRSQKTGKLATKAEMIETLMDANSPYYNDIDEAVKAANGPVSVAKRSKFSTPKKSLTQAEYQEVLDDFFRNNPQKLGDDEILAGVADAIKFKAAEPAYKTAEDVASEMADFLHRKGDRFLKTGEKYYSGNVLQNHFDYTKGLVQAKANADATVGYFGSNLTNNANDVPIAEAFKALKWNDRAIAKFTEKYGPDAANKFIPKNVVDGAASILKKQDSPEWMKPILKITDGITRFYKANMTLPFTSFHTRNLVSGHWMNMASNEIETIGDLVKYKNAWNTAEEALRDPKKHKQLLDEMKIYEVVGKQSHDVDLSKPGATPFQMPESMNYASPLKGGPVRGTASAIGEAFDIGKEAIGKGEYGAAIKSPYTALHNRGAEMASQIEYSNRATMFVYLREKGWSPEAAAKRVNDLQVDYSALSPFEKSVARRVVPFYSYSRRALPEVLKSLVERPGGLTAQTVRASNVGRDDREALPAYISEGMSVAIPGGGYLSEFGLPTDQFSDLFARGPTALGTVKRTGQKLASQLHPLIKAPIEAVTGVNMFTGRPLTDLYQYPTDYPLANFALSNSPGSRVLSTTRTIGDERKTIPERALNLATGVRITHPSGGLEKQRDYAARAMLSEMMKNEGVGSFENVYLREDRDYPQHVIDMYRAYRGVVNKQRDEKKSQKKAAAGAVE